MEQGSQELDSSCALRIATETEASILIGDIVGHPHGSICIKELKYMNPRLSEAALRCHLKQLQFKRIVACRALDHCRCVYGYPVEFYELTDRARNIFDKFGLFPESAWKRQYARVEKTERIRCLEQLPRPEHKQ